MEKLLKLISVVLIQALISLGIQGASAGTIFAKEDKGINKSTLSPRLAIAALNIETMFKQSLELEGMTSVKSNKGSNQTALGMGPVVDYFLETLTTEEKSAQVKLILNKFLKEGDFYHIDSVDRKLDQSLAYLPRSEQTEFIALHKRKLVAWFLSSLAIDTVQFKNNAIKLEKISQSI